MTVTVRGEQLGLLARMRRARLIEAQERQQGRAILSCAAPGRSPKLLNFVELQQPTTSHWALLPFFVADLQEKIVDSAP